MQAMFVRYCLYGHNRKDGSIFGSLKNVLKKTLKNSTILVEIFFKVKEDISDYKEISSELKEGDDSEGNN